MKSFHFDCNSLTYKHMCKYTHIRELCLVIKQYSWLEFSFLEDISMWFLSDWKPCCAITLKSTVEPNAHLVPSMQLTCLLKGWMGLRQVSDFKNYFGNCQELGATWVLTEATSIAVKMFACCWILLCSVELKGLICILSRILGANTKWRLLHLKHRHLEAGKLSSVPALVVCFQVTITCPVVS